MNTTIMNITVIMKTKLFFLKPLLFISFLLVATTVCGDPCIEGASIDGLPTVSDSDGDGVNDVCDLDDDNDGILDIDEANNCSGSDFLIRYQNGSNLVAYDPLTGAETIITTIPSDINLNGIAYNYDQGGLVYGQTTTDTSEIVVYNPATNLWTSVGTVPGRNFSSGGGAYYDGTLYWGDFYNAVIAVNLSADGLTLTSSTVFSDDPFGNGGGDWGDMTVGLGCNGNMTLFVSLFGEGLGSIDLESATPTNNTATIITTNYPGQVGYVDGVLYATNGTTSVNSVDVCTGATTSTALSLGSIAPDFSGGIPSCYLVTDTDLDGLADYLDLDSDGDGCPDALEGAGIYVFTDLVTSTMPGGNSTGAGTYTGTAGAVQQNLGSSSNDDGTPNIEGTITTDSETQGIGESQNADIYTACCTDATNFTYITDTDGDGIGNDCDLDDDNDGILDTIECPSVINIPFKNAFLSQAGITISGADKNNLAYSSSAASGSGWSTAAISEGYTASSTLTDYTISYTVGGIFGTVVFGINDVSTTPSYTDMNHGIYRGGSTLHVVENGGFVNLTSLGVTVVVGDVVSIKKTGTTIAYQKNGVTFRTSPVATLAVTPASWMVDVAFNKNGTTAYSLNNINIDFGGCGVDTDGDGLTNNLDLDSDGDGCPDALEGAGTYEFADLVVDTNLDGGNTGGSFAGVAVAIQQNLGNSSNTDGTPNRDGNTATSESQGLGDSNDGSISIVCCADAPNFTYLTDTDGDGIGDACDLDIDNDGISNTDECEQIGLFDFNNFSGTDLTTASYSEVQEGVTMTKTSGGTLRFINTASNSFVLMNDATSASLAYFTFSEDLNIKSVLFKYIDPIDPVSSLIRFYDVDGIIIPFSSTPTNITTGGNVLVTFSGANNVRQVRFYEEGLLLGGSNSSAFNDLAFAKSVAPCVDTDGDGIVDVFDLDSDGDGCPDAIEGGANHPSSALVNDPNIAGGNTDGDPGFTGTAAPVQDNLGITVDTDPNSPTFGVPIVAPADTAAFQGVGTSRFVNIMSDACDCSLGASADGTPTASDSDGDGINDICDVDDDNDGILDTSECASLANDLSFTTAGGGGLTYTGNTINFTTSGASNGYSNSAISPVFSTYSSQKDFTLSVTMGASSDWYYYFGINESNTANNNDIDFGFGKSPGGDMSVIVLGVQAGVYEPYVAGDVFSLKKTGTTIQFQKNGVTFYIPPTVQVSLTADYFFDTSFYKSTSGGGATISLDDITIEFPTCEDDLDLDGIVNTLDLDSDGDGCPDALEGAGTYAFSNLVTSTMAGGNTDSIGFIGTAGPVQQNFGTTVDTISTSSTYGVPIVSPANTAVAQGVGSSNDANVQSSPCMMIAENDINQTPQNIPVGGNVLTNDLPGLVSSALIDTDNDGVADANVPLGSPYTIAGVGEITLNTDGTYLFTPIATFTGDVPIIEYTAEDSNGNENTATLSIEVIPYLTTDNNPPLAQDDTNSVEQGETVTTSILGNDSDPDGDMLTVDNVTGLDMNGSPLTLTTSTQSVYDENGLLAGQASIDANGNVIFIADANFTGDVPFDYTISDGNGGMDSAMITITVEASDPNDNDVNANDDAATGGQGESIPGNVLTNDTNPDGIGTPVVSSASDSAGNPLVIDGTTSNSLPSGGTLVINTDGTYTYTPDPDFLGTEIVTYEVCDGGTPQACDLATLYLTILAAPNTLVAINDFNNTPINTPADGSVLGNDVDPDGDNLTVNTTPVSAPTNGTVTLNTDGTYTYTPNADFVGEDTFEYEVCDDGTPSVCDTASVTIQVLPLLIEGNNPPVVNDDVAVTPVDTPVSGDILTNDSDPDGDLLIVNTTPVSGPTNGTIVINADGTYTYTPNPGFEGTDMITIEVCDDGTPAECMESVLTIEVIPANNDNEVYAQDDAGVGEEGNPIDGDLLGNDTDPEDDNLTVNTTPVDGPDNGTVVINPDGTYVFTPNPDFVGNDMFTYSVCDDGTPVVCDTATVYLTILAGPNTLVAINDVNNTPINTPADGSVLGNDVDPNGDNLTVNTTPVSAPTNGTVTLNTDGTYTYTPNADFVGEDTFEYEVCDDGTPSVCDTASVTIQVLPLLIEENNPPVVNDDVAVTPVDTPVSGDILTNDSDPDGDLLIVNTTPISGPTNGTIVINADGTYTYTPNPGFEGIDMVTIEVCDDGTPAECKESVLTIEVIPANNDNEVFAQDDAGVGEEGNPIDGDLLGNDTDPENDNLTINTTPVDGPDNGTVVINPDGTYVFTPNPDFVGNDMFTYSVCDDGTPVVCDTATVYLTILAGPNTLVAINDINSTPINAPVDGSVLGNDVDPEGDNLTVNTTPVNVPTNGTVTLNTDGTYTYTPNTDFVGEDSFEYEVCDDGTPSVCDTASVTIQVLPLLIEENNPPVVNDDVAVTPVDTPVSGDITTNDSDPDGDLLIVNTTPVSGPTNGTIVINADGTYTYTPNPGFEGIDMVTIEVCDDGTPAECKESVLIIEVIPANNDNEVYAQDDAGVGEEGNQIIGDLLGNDTDPENDNITVNTTPVSGPANGTLVINPDGTYGYTPDPTFVGNDIFKYAICDDGMPVACDTATVYITVLPDPLPENTTSAFDDMDETDVNVDVCGSVLTNDVDDEGDTQTVNSTPVTDPANGSVVLSPDGTYTYTPNTGFVGSDTFEYEVCDDGTPVACDTAQVTIQVGGSAIELTTNFFIDGNTFLPTQQRDGVYVIENIGTAATISPIQFFISKATGDFTTVILPTTSTAAVFGGISVDNSDWDIVDQGSIYVCTLKAGRSISAGGTSLIALTISTSSSLISSTAQTSGQLIDFTSGDVIRVNNFAQSTFIIN